jgi:hypothetical protein
MPTNVSWLSTQKALLSTRYSLERFHNPKVLFCLIVVLLTAVVMLRFPNLGAIIAQYNQF